MNTVAYTVSQEAYSGPLELLLTLIERRTLSINQVSLATVAEDYVSYLESHPEFPLEETAQFVAVASTLVLIKSRSLLPTLTLTTEEEESAHDLEDRLKHYQLIRSLVRSLHTRDASVRLYARTVRAPRAVVFAPDASLEQYTLHAAAERVLRAAPKDEPALKEATVRTVVSLEEMMDRLKERVTVAMRSTFNEFAGVGREEKVHVVVSFLALLELVKKGALRVEQHAPYADITMESHEITLPRYS